jgi:hypothetical protein
MQVLLPINKILKFTPSTFQYDNIKLVSKTRSHLFLCLSQTRINSHKAFEYNFCTHTLKMSNQNKAFILGSVLIVCLIVVFFKYGYKLMLESFTTIKPRLLFILELEWFKLWLLDLLFITTVDMFSFNLEINRLLLFTIH